MKSKKYNLTLPTDDQGGEKDFEVWKVYSIWPQVADCRELGLILNEYYHLHPEFVDKEELEHNQNNPLQVQQLYSAMICEKCLSHIRKNKDPPMSLCEGVDFGCPWRIGLEPL